MGRKFIPNGDGDFATMARCFAQRLGQDPARYAVSREDADAVMVAVERFRAALAEARAGGVRSAAKTAVKEQARVEAERLVRRAANAIRANENLDATARIEIGMRERATARTRVGCPQEPPRLTFVRARHEGNATTPRHELRFTSLDRKARPEGAARLELFVGLVPPEEEIPGHPGANYGMWWWYLQSYSRSPIVLVPPIPRVPMRVVYWGRWAGTTGDVGPFSATAVGWVEGGSHAMLPGGVGMAFDRRYAVRELDVDEATGANAAVEKRERKYVVAVLEAQVESVMGAAGAGRADVGRLPCPAEREMRRIGTGEAEAA